jgi:hypothetical protein
MPQQFTQATQPPTIPQASTNALGETPHPTSHPPSGEDPTGRSRHQASTKQTGKISSSKNSIPYSQILLWYKRIGHVNFQSLYHMTSRNLVAGTSRIPLIKHTCSSCILGKMPRDKIPKLRSTLTTKPLQIIYSDIFWPHAHPFPNWKAIHPHLHRRLHLKNLANFSSSKIPNP